MEGKNGYDSQALLETTGVSADQVRRWHLLFERMGILYSESSITHLTDLGKRILECEQGVVDGAAVRWLRRQAAFCVSISLTIPPIGNQTSSTRMTAIFILIGQF